MKGDPYIRDMKHTSSVCGIFAQERALGPLALNSSFHVLHSGHVAELTSGWFNPKNAAEFITSSNDSTVRCVRSMERAALYLLGC